VRSTDQDRTKKEEMEIENEVDGENMYSPMRHKKNCEPNGRGKSPRNGHGMHSKTV
jgi:hypothetical protein